MTDQRQRIIDELENVTDKKNALIDEGRRIIGGDGEDRLQRLELMIRQYRELLLQEEFLGFCLMYDDVRNEELEVFNYDRNNRE